LPDCSPRCRYLDGVDEAAEDMSQLGVDDQAEFERLSGDDPTAGPLRAHALTGNREMAEDLERVVCAINPPFVHGRVPNTECTSVDSLAEASRTPPSLASELCLTRPRDRLQVCPSCGRCFAPSVLERHGPMCAKRAVKAAVGGGGGGHV
jgi:hypothetical protein